MGSWFVTALAVLLLVPVNAVNILYGGVAIKVDVPASGTIIRGSFKPVYSIELYDGYLGENILVFLVHVLVVLVGCLTDDVNLFVVRQIIINQYVV